MYVRFWGTRGSIAKAGPTTLRYGGNTSCIELRSDAGTLLVIDCGTGAHGLGTELLAEASGAPLHGHILISHTHWDHIQGLPFFGPLFVPGNRWHVYGPKGLGSSIADTLSGQMEYSYFPVSIEQLGGVTAYHDLVEGEFEIDDVRVRTQYLNHPALTLGFRIEADGASVVYLCDHEPYHRDLADGRPVAASEHDRRHADFAAGADLLVHDAQYLASEYDGKVGWGHSPVEYVVAVGRHAGVERLALTHHDPSRTDDDVERLVDVARAHAGEFADRVFAAEEGMLIELRGEGDAPEQAGSSASATRQLALDEIRRTVLIAVRSPEIRDAMCDVAAAEQFELDVVAVDDVVTAARDRRPALVVVEADDDRLREIGDAIADIDGPDGHDITVVSIGASAPVAAEQPGAFVDQLSWPASTVYLRTKLRAWLLRRACRWQPAPLPADESRRLRLLRSLGILDTLPEERFDRLTELASEACDTPIAAVSLVDDGRQWFKSRVGLDAAETPRDVSFCAHAILTDGVFQVPDALHDPRFADNPLVATDPRMRFYAGVPLTVADGTRIGTLCVIDYRPRALDEEQVEELLRLGDLVAREIESG